MGLERRLAERTLELVDCRSPSREEAAIAELVADRMPGEPLHRAGETLYYRLGAGERPLVVLAGHLDTVPVNGNLPGRLAGGAVHGLGASDMKAGVAVMVELARELAERPLAVDLGFLFFPREELPAVDSALPAFFETGLVDAAALVVVLEPTDNTVQAGCLGNVNARLVFRGESAHSARPWLGVNAIGVAVRALERIVGLEPHDVEVEGLVFREVLSATTIAGGLAQNVIPDDVRCTVNFRYAPSRTPEQARERLAQLLDGFEVEILNESPPARVAARSPLVERLVRLGGFRLEPKQAWTPVAEFAGRGLDAVNLGPGATRFAHRRDEQVEVAELVRTFEALHRLAVE